MSQPTPYERGYSFTDFSSGSPSSQPPGTQLDAEYDGIAETLADVLANLALIQRDDGLLANASVGVDQLSEAALALLASGSFVVRGNWATSTAYAAGDIFSDDGIIYLTMVAHTSSAIATDVTAERVALMFDATNQALAEALALSTGAALVGSTGGITVQAALNFKASTSTLALASGAGLLGFSYAETYAAGTIGKSLQQRSINLADAPYSAPSDGLADATVALQAACDALTGGGVIDVPAGTYSITHVDVVNRGITIRPVGGAVTFKKRGSAGAASRGIFRFANLVDAGFVVDGITFDLNGEGPYDIGVAGRLTNFYSTQTMLTVAGIAGPANAALYAIRSSGFWVRNCTIKNSGENGLLFRNCGKYWVEDCTFDNIANWAIEINNAAVDGGSGDVPVRDDVMVSGCKFTRINDFAMGSGNGGAIGGGGGASFGAVAFKNYRFYNNTIVDCYRGIQVEFPAIDSYLQQVDCSGNSFEEIGQNAITFIGLRSATIDNNKGHNIGHPAAFALCYQRQVDGGRNPLTEATYPDIAAVIISGGLNSDVKVGRFIQTDDRSGGVVKLTDGVATSGDATFTSASATFTSNDVGKRIAILGAGPSGFDANGNPYGPIVHETTIASYNSAHSVELTQYPFTSIPSSAKFAYGGACRNGFIGVGAVDIDVVGCTFEAGTSMGLLNEATLAPASAMRIEDISVRAVIDDNTLIAPTNGGTKPTGFHMRVVGTFAGDLYMLPNNTITGFTAAMAGVYTNKASVVTATKGYIEDKGLTPSATIDTFGTAEALFPDTVFFSEVLRGSVEAAGTFNGGGETITFRFQAAFFDGTDGPTVDITLTAVGTTQLTAKHLKKLNPDDVMLRAVTATMKSSRASSLVTGKINLTARQM